MAAVVGARKLWSDIDPLDPDCEILQGPLHVPFRSSDGGVDSTYCRLSEFQLIERNGFLEFVEEEPSLVSRSRRAYTWTDVGHFGISRMHLPFSLPMTCLAAESCQTDDQGSVESTEVGDRSVASASESLEDVASQTSSSDLLGCSDDPWVEEAHTTVQVRNIPCDFTRDQFLQVLDGAGFGGQYSFVYLPFEFALGQCVGYADVCLVDPVVALRLFRQFQGFVWQHSVDHVSGPGLVCETAWAERQTITEHVERYRDSPIMHPSVPDGRKPAIFERGVRVAFPRPTRPVRRPRIRHAKN